MYMKMPYGNQLIKNNLDTGASKNSEVNNICYSLEGSEFGSQKARSKLNSSKPKSMSERSDALFGSHEQQV